MTDTRYEAPSGAMFTASNRLVGGLARIGAAPKCVHELQTVGRNSGEIRRTPVNVLVVDGRRFLFSPRGNTQWVRNVRAGGAVTLRRGRRTDAVTLTELDASAKPAIIREYLAKWGWQVSDFVGGLTAASSDTEILSVESGFPVFEVRV